MPRFNAEVQKPKPTNGDTMNTQPQTAKEVIAANVKLLIEQLEAGHSEGLTAYLDAMGRFHNYSFGNILEIARQRPTRPASLASMRGTSLGRKVRKGERGIRILAPSSASSARRTRRPRRTSPSRTAASWLAFRNAYVFDRLSRDLRPAWPATARRRRARRVQACSSMAAATSSLSSVARCKAVWMRTSSSSRAAICPAGSLCPLAAFRLR
jgi:hypothetical protein